MPPFVSKMSASTDGKTFNIERRMSGVIVSVSTYTERKREKKHTSNLTDPACKQHVVIVSQNKKYWKSIVVSLHFCSNNF